MAYLLTETEPMPFFAAFSFDRLKANYTLAQQLFFFLNSALFVIVGHLGSHVEFAAKPLVCQLTPKQTVHPQTKPVNKLVNSEGMGN